LAPQGVLLSSPRTVALAIAHLAYGGLKSSKQGLMIEEDTIRSVEQELSLSQPEWFVKITQNDAASDLYKDNIS